MKASHLLAAVYEGRISDVEADRLVDELLDSPNAADIAALLCLTPAEWTAYAQGASWQAVARWKYEGWPSHCVVCKQAINVVNFGWFVVESNDGFVLKHIECPKDN